MKKQPEKAERTKYALTAAFWELYKKRPISKITVKDVTDAAGFYRSTFYFYFSDIYAILEHIENTILEDWDAMTFELFEQGKQEKLIEHITEFYNKYGEYMSVLLSPMGDPMFLKNIKDTMRPKMFALVHLSENDIEASLIFEFIISAMLAFLTEWYKHSKNITAEQAVKLLESLSKENITSVMLRHASDPDSLYR